MLITLAIIGIVAALTVPTLMHKHQIHTRKTQLKRSYALLSNAITRHRADTGTTNYCTLLGSGNHNKHRESLYALLKPYVKDIINCGTNSDGSWNNTGKCKELLDLYWLKSVVKSYDGSTSCAFGETNGVLYGAGIAISRGWVLSWIPVTIHVDVNGIQGPNRYGMDIFEFDLSCDGVLSPAAMGTSWQSNCSDPSVRWGYGACTQKALYDENYWKQKDMK